MLHVECATVLRRLAKGQLSPAATREATRRLADALEEVTLKPLDRDIAAIISATEALGECRTLDVAHVATAIFFRQGGDSELRLCTFDLRMAEVAARAGFVVVTHQG